jgi:hypothetical protein
MFIIAFFVNSLIKLWFMVTEQTPATKFTPLQMELLKLYSKNITEEDLVAIKQLIANYFIDKLQKKVSEAALKSGYQTQEDFDSILNDPNQ